MNAVHLRDLRKIYKVHERVAGLFAAARSLVKRRTRQVRAVDGIAFDVPVAFAVTVPAEGLVGRLAPRMSVQAAALAALMLMASRLFRRVGIRQYAGASA